MQAYLWIAVGGALGSMARYWTGGVVARHVGEAFPWGTLIINVAGSFIIGFFAAISGPEGRIHAGVDGRLFVMAGFCGGFTTFSAFSLQTLDLMQKGEWLSAGANIAGSVVLCLIGVWLGHVAATVLNAGR